MLANIHQHHTEKPYQLIHALTNDAAQMMQ